MHGSHSPFYDRVASPTVESLTGARLAQIVRALDSAGRMRLALEIAAGRIEVETLTPSQICDLVKVPASHRMRVLEVGATRLRRVGGRP